MEVVVEQKAPKVAGMSYFALKAPFALAMQLQCGGCRPSKGLGFKPHREQLLWGGGRASLPGGLPRAFWPATAPFSSPLALGPWLPMSIPQPLPRESEVKKPLAFSVCPAFTHLPKAAASAVPVPSSPLCMGVRLSV